MHVAGLVCATSGLQAPRQPDTVVPSIYIFIIVNLDLNPNPNLNVPKSPLTDIVASPYTSVLHAILAIAG